MKIRLPKGLRKALLACLTTLFVGLPTTLGTASGADAICADVEQYLKNEYGILAIASNPATGGWPDDSRYNGQQWDLSGGAETQVTQSGSVKFKEGAGNGNVTITGGDSEQNGIDVRLYGNNGSEFGAPTVTMSGHIKSLLIENMQIRFESGKWVSNGATIADIYVKNAMLFMKETLTLDTNLHLGGRYDSNAWEGALRVNSQDINAPCTVTLSGALVVESDTLITVQYGSVFKLTGMLATGSGGATHNLRLGSHSGLQGNAHIEFLGGGELQGKLEFYGHGEHGVPYLVLGKGSGAGETVTLTVFGIESTECPDDFGGRIETGGEGQGTATLALNGSETYTYNGTLGTATAPEAHGGWSDASALNLTVQLSGGKQTLSGNAHLHDLTISGGTLVTTATVQVDGTLNANGGTTEINGTAIVKNMGASGGNLTLGDGARLVLDATTGTITLGTLAWSGEATIDLRGMLAGLQFAATTLQAGEVLHILLSEDFLRSILGDIGGYQLFTSGIWKDTHVKLEGNGYRIKCGDDGVITVAEAIPCSWEVKADAPTFTWDAEIGAGTTPWTEGSGATDGCPVTMTNNEAQNGATVTLTGSVQAGSVTFDGKYGFTLTASDGNSSLTTAGGLTLNTTLLCDAAIHVSGTLTGTGNIQIGEYEPDSGAISGSITVGGEDDIDFGGWLSVAQGSFSATKAHVRLGGGLTSDQLAVNVDPEYLHDREGTVNVKSLETNVEKGEMAYEGTLTVTEALTKTGAGKQTIYGSSLTIGSVDVQGGILHIGGPQYETDDAHKPNLSTGSISVSGGSFEWQAGTLTVTGKIAIAGEGAAMRVLTGDLSLSANNVNDLLVINGTGASLDVTGSIVTQGGDGGSINVKGGGSLTAASLSGINNGNANYFGHGHAPILNVGEESNETVTTGTVTIGSEQAGDALLQVKHLTVIGEGSSVTVWGDLSSSYGDESSIKDGVVKVSGNMVQQGALTIDGGTLELGGYYANASSAPPANGGAITLSNGGRVTVGGGLHTKGVTMSGTEAGASMLQLSDAEEATTNTVEGLTMGEYSRVEVGVNQTLTVGTLTLNAPAGSAAVTLTMTSAGNNLDISHLTLGEEAGALTIELRGYSEWVAAHPGETTYQLFNEGNFGTLVGGLDGELSEYFRFVVDTDERLKCTLSTSGALTIELDEGIYWTGGNDGVWDAGAAGESGDTHWEGEAAPDTDSYVTFDEKAQGEVKLNGAVEVDGVQILSGTYTFVPNNPEGETDSLTANELIVRSGAMLNLGAELKAGSSGGMVVKLEGGLDVRGGAELGDGVKVRFNGGVLKYTEDSAEGDIVSGKVDAEGSTGNVKIEVAGGLNRQWGNTKTTPEDNGGLKLALGGKGLEKSGEGNFTLAWQETGGEAHTGKMAVKGGTLTLDVDAVRPAMLTGGATVDGGATLELKASGDKLSVGGVEGEGKLKVSQGNVSLTGSSTVSAIELAAGNTTVDSDDALNCATLTLSGGSIASGAGHTVKAGTVNVDAPTTVSGSVNLTGTIKGSGTLSAKSGAMVTLSGQVTDFGGTLDTGDGTIVLGMPGEVKAKVTGNGILAAQGKVEVVLSGILSEGQFTLQSAGSGRLVVASRDVSADVRLDTGGAGGSIVLGAHGGEGGQVQWNGTAPVQGTGNLVLANVKLADGSTFDGGSAHLLVDTADAAAAAVVAADSTHVGGIVDVNGMNAEQLDGISVNKGGVLKGLTGTYKVAKDRGLYLYFDPTNWGDAAAREAGSMNALIEGSEVTLDLGGGDGAVFEFDDGTIYKCFNSEQETDLYLRVVEGGSIVNTPALSQWQSWLPGLVQKVQYTEDGYVILTGRTDDIYVVANDGRDSEVSEKPGLLASKKATVVLDGKTLTLNWEGGTTNETVLHNLLGTEGTELLVNNTADNPKKRRLSLGLDNTLAEEIHDAKYNPDSLPKPDGTTARGQNTTFLGSITAGDGVDVDKWGKGTLTVGGNYTLADGTTTLSEGALVLRGKENSMVNLTFAYATEQDTTKEPLRGLVLDGGGVTTLKGEIVDAENKGGNDVYLRNGAKLVLQGTSKLNSTDFIGENNGGTLVLEGSEEKGAELALGAGVLSGVAVQLNAANTILDIGGGASSVTTLSGNGTLKSKDGSILSVENGNFSGTLDSSDGSSAGRLVVQNFTLKNVTTKAENPAQGWGLQVVDGGNLTIDVSEKGKRDSVVFGDVDLGSGGMTTILLNSDTYNAETQNGKDTITGTTFNVGEGTTIVLEAVAGGDWDDYRALTLGQYSDVTGLPNPQDIQLKGDAFLLLEVKEVTVEADGSVKLVLAETDGNPFLESIPNGEKNAKAGAVLVGESLRHKINESSKTDVMGSGTDYANLVHGLFDMIENQAPGLQRTYAAVAGASISTLGPAVTEDIHRQLNAIRNRMTTMANEVTEETHDKLPLWHAWINAEGNYHKLDADSLAPGYTLNSWGGTVGVDADVSPHITVGLAISAMYGDLETDAADSATGSVDTTYLSAFLRAAKGSWVHSFVVTCGIAEVDLDRTVNYGSGSYSTNGSTDGYTFGAMYEVGYTGFVNKRGTAALQPVANVEVRHISLKGYSETGSDAGLTVDDMERTVLTFGVGARAQVAVGANAFNRTSVLESRALLKFDVGDRSGTARNAIIGDSTYAETESAEVGAVGVEVGVGISVPLGAQSGSVFADGSLEFRDGWTSANATLGYRVTF